MKKKHIYNASLLVFGGIFIAIGIIVLVQHEVVLVPATYIGSLVILAHGGHNVLKFITAPKGKKNTNVLLTGVMNIFLGGFVLLLTDLTFSMLIFAYTLYVFLNALVKFIDYGIYLKNGISGRLIDLSSAIFFTVFGVLLLFLPDLSQQALLILAGVYLICYGGCEIYTFIIHLIPQSAKNKLKRKIRIRLPVFISTFMPLRFLREINSYVETRDKDETKTYYDEKIDINPDAEADVEVLIHVSNNGFGRMGHCDMYFDGEILSYGNYDQDSHKLFGALGDGVFFVAEKKRYLEFSIASDKKMLISYGLKLSDEQITALRAEVYRMKSNTRRWKSRLEISTEKGEGKVFDDFGDYGSRLWNGTHAKFYKFKSGRFKTYFLLSTNCVLLTDNFLGKTGTDIVKLNGIITPGSYFDYMENELNVEGSMVVSRRIYSKDTVEITGLWQDTSFTLTTDT